MKLRNLYYFLTVLLRDCDGRAVYLGIRKTAGRVHKAVSSRRGIARGKSR